MSDNKRRSVCASSQLVADAEPSVAEVVPPRKDLHVKAVGNELLHVLVHLLRLLRLSPPLAVDHVTANAFDGLVAADLAEVALESDEAGLLCVLQVVAVSVGDAAVHRLFDPADVADHGVAPLLEELQRQPVLGVDDPHEEQPVLLQQVDGQRRDDVVAQLRIAQRHSARRVRRGQHPWGPS